jgi:hypothetical protein
MSNTELTRGETVKLVGRWIADRAAGSVVRFGEGEGRLLVADPSDPVSVTVAVKKLRRQTGVVYSADEMFKIKRLVLNAFDEADVVGLRGSSTFNDEHQMWVERIEAAFEERVAAGRKPAYVTHCLVNSDLRDSLPSLLAAASAVSIISCRDLQEVFERDYDVDEVRIFQIPSQFIMRRVDGDYEQALHDTPIWPAFYADLRQRLTVREPGEVFLVGAGIFGKDLCIRARELGGIALDMGSTLDRLAGKVTRGRNKPEPYQRPR